MPKINSLLLCSYDAYQYKDHKNAGGGEEHRKAIEAGRSACKWCKLASGSDCLDVRQIEAGQSACKRCKLANDSDCLDVR